MQEKNIYLEGKWVPWGSDMPIFRNWAEELNPAEEVETEHSRSITFMVRKDIWDYIDPRPSVDNLQQWSKSGLMLASVEPISQRWFLQMSTCNWFDKEH